AMRRADGHEAVGVSVRAPGPGSRRPHSAVASRDRAVARPRTATGAAARDRASTGATPAGGPPGRGIRVPVASAGAAAGRRAADVAQSDPLGLHGADLFGSDDG